jgi:hypothetical protein
MYAMCVVIVSEFSQLPGEVGDVPEEHAIEKLTPNRPDQPFDELCSARIRAVVIRGAKGCSLRPGLA